MAEKVLKLPAGVSEIEREGHAFTATASSQLGSEGAAEGAPAGGCARCAFLARRIAELEAQLTATLEANTISAKKCHELEVANHALNAGLAHERKRSFMGTGHLVHMNAPASSSATGAKHPLAAAAREEGYDVKEKAPAPSGAVEQGAPQQAPGEARETLGNVDDNNDDDGGRGGGGCENGGGSRAASSRTVDPECEGADAVSEGVGIDDGDGAPEAARLSDADTDTSSSSLLAMIAGMDEAEPAAPASSFPMPFGGVVAVRTTDRAPCIVCQTPDDCLEFGEVFARVTPSELVGIRRIGDSGAQTSYGPSSSETGSRRSSSSSLSSFMNGSSSTQQQHAMPATESGGSSPRSSFGRRQGGFGDRRKSHSSQVGTWEIVFKEGGGDGQLRRISFDGTPESYEYVTARVEAWEHAASQVGSALGVGNKEFSEAKKEMLATTREYLIPSDATDAWPFDDGGEDDGRGVFENRSPFGSGVKTSMSADAQEAGSGGLSSYTTWTSAMAARFLPLSPSSAPSTAGRHSSSSSSTMTKREGDALRNSTSLLTRRQVSAIVSALPIRHKLNRWRLAYSTHRDGTSLNTLYRKCARLSPTVMVIRDDAGHVFGCFAPESWSGPGAGQHGGTRQHSLKRYYGTGETFVFQLVPEMVAYRWSRENNYFMVSSSSYLAVGGGGASSSPAIYIGEDLLHGSSGECETFRSKVLSKNRDFVVKTLECWHIH